MSRIIVIGSLNMNLVVTAPRIPVIGETILGSGFMTAPEGKGANQAVAAARLGGDVTIPLNTVERAIGITKKHNDFLNNSSVSIIP